MTNLNVDGVAKSLLYGNADGSSISAVVFNNVMATNLGGGQGTIDIRKGTYEVVTIQNSTIVGGRDFIRADADRVTGAINIVNNTFIPSTVLRSTMATVCCTSVLRLQATCSRTTCS